MQVKIKLEKFAYRLYGACHHPGNPSWLFPCNSQNTSKLQFLSPGQLRTGLICHSFLEHIQHLQKRKWCNCNYSTSGNILSSYQQYNWQLHFEIEVKRRRIFTYWAYKRIFTECEKNIIVLEYTHKLISTTPNPSICRSIPFIKLI